MRTNLSNVTPEQMKAHKERLLQQHRDGKVADEVAIQAKEEEAIKSAMLKLDEQPDGLLSQLRPAAMNRKLLYWASSGYPERCATNGKAMEAIKKIECEHRSVGGYCRKCGCGQDKDKNVACMWLYRMATESCPDGKFAAVKQETRS
jgi:hypothetical protein